MGLKYVGTFVLTDSSLDRHSERVMVEGVDLEPFKANPVMFYNHHRSRGWNDVESMRVTPIGIWDNIRKENGKVLADAMIDEDDENAMKIGKKVESGVLRTASIGFRALSFSDDNADKLPGQRGLTITKSEIREASIVDIPSNPNAVLISKAVRAKSLSEGDDISGEEMYFQKDYRALEAKSAPVINNNNQKSTSMFASIRNWFKSMTGQEIPENATEEQVNEIVAKAVEENKSIKDAIMAEIRPELDELKNAAPSTSDVSKSDFDALSAKFDSFLENYKTVETQLEEEKAKNAELQKQKDAADKKLLDMKANAKKGDKNSDGGKSTVDKLKETVKEKKDGVTVSVPFAISK